jgi:hypothetical protein
MRACVRAIVQAYVRVCARMCGVFVCVCFLSFSLSFFISFFLLFFFIYLLACPQAPPTDDTFTILPLRCARINGSAAFWQRITPGRIKDTWQVHTRYTWHARSTTRSCHLPAGAARGAWPSRTEEIGLELRFALVEREHLDRAERREARVVHQHVEPGVGLRDLLEGLADRFVRANIELQNLHAPCVR